MTFEQIEKQLPYGFHDAGLLALAIDYETRVAVFRLELRVGRPGGASLDRYRCGRLTVNALSLFAMVAPEAASAYASSGYAQSLHGDVVRPGYNPAVEAVWAALPPGSVRYRFFVADWNSFIYVAGANVEFVWLED